MFLRKKQCTLSFEKKQNVFWIKKNQTEMGNVLSKKQLQECIIKKLNLLNKTSQS